MSFDQPAAQDHGPREPGGGEVGKRDKAVDVLLLLVTMLALLGIATGIAIRFPWALESATTYADASPVVPSGSPAQDPRHQPEEATEEKPEPFIADDIRTEVLMYASAGITTSSFPRSPYQMSDGGPDVGEYEGSIPSFRQAL